MEFVDKMISQLEDMKRPTDNDTLRAKLAQAMGNCCEWPGNRALFGGSGAVAPLVNYLGKISLVNCLLLLANCLDLNVWMPMAPIYSPFGYERPCNPYYMTQYVKYVCTVCTMYTYLHVHCTVKLAKIRTVLRLLWCSAISFESWLLAYLGTNGTHMLTLWVSDAM